MARFRAFRRKVYGRPEHRLYFSRIAAQPLSRHAAARAPRGLRRTVALQRAQPRVVQFIASCWAIRSRVPRLPAREAELWFVCARASAQPAAQGSPKPKRGLLGEAMRAKSLALLLLALGCGLAAKPSGSSSRGFFSISPIARAKSLEIESWTSL